MWNFLPVMADKTPILSNVSVLTIPKTENNYALRAGTEDAYTHHKTRPIY